MVRDRLAALLQAVRRERLTHALRRAGRCVVRRGDTTWTIDDGRLVDTTISGEVGRALPVDPPEPAVAGRPLARRQVDEVLCLAKYFERHAARLDIVSCTGSWEFPVGATDELPRLVAADQPDPPPSPAGSSAQRLAAVPVAVGRGASAGSTAASSVVTTAPS